MPKFNSSKTKAEYEQKLIDIARVARVVAGGKRFRFRACVCVGNKKGKVGLGVAKGNDVADAISKAAAKAKKNLCEVPLQDGTIPYTIKVNFGGAQIFLKPARPGTGIIAGGPIRAIIELSGIKNILSKIQRSENKLNNAKATFLALKSLESPADLARGRGKELKEIAPYLVKK